MLAKSANTRQKLMAATIRLVAQGGDGAATIRNIASEVQITEGAVYRHFRSKDELCWEAYKRVVVQMAAEKQGLVTSDAPIRDRLREWIWLSFSFYDRNSEAFTYVLLNPPKMKAKDEDVTKAQGRLFQAMFKQAIHADSVRSLPLDVALCHFGGLMLNIPRMINEGALAGPATQYVEETANAVWRVFEP
jgi:AcrR family transcriptional regulator